MVIAGPYFFDHIVASQMAQWKEFNLKNPSAYHYDILLLWNHDLGLWISWTFSFKWCVVPQYPIHTKSLAVLKRQRQSAVNAVNRGRSKTNHACGSRSFATRAYKMLEDGGDIDLPDFYRSCHFSKAKKDWVSSASKTYHENMIKLQQKRTSQPNSTPLSAEELSVQCLGARSGLLNGLGMRPSSCTHSTTTSTQASEHVKHLEKKMEEMAAQMTSMYQWAQRHGYDGSGGSPSANEAS